MGEDNFLEQAADVAGHPCLTCRTIEPTAAILVAINMDSTYPFETPPGYGVLMSVCAACYRQYTMDQLTEAWCDYLCERFGGGTDGVHKVH